MYIYCENTILFNKKPNWFKSNQPDHDHLILFMCLSSSFFLCDILGFEFSLEALALPNITFQIPFFYGFVSVGMFRTVRKEYHNYVWVANEYQPNLPNHQNH